jgi:hypothetical protein
MPASLVGQELLVDEFVGRVYRENVDKVVLVSAFDSSENPVSQGSGFILSPDGTVITNHHVIAGADSIQVKTRSGAYYMASGVSAVDCNADLALLDLSVEGDELPHVELAETSKVQVGDAVVAIGNPLSLEASVSDGIVSGIRESSDRTHRYIQTTAPVSSGNSGGPLLDRLGRVIGVVSFKYSAGENINFAISSESIDGLIENASQASSNIVSSVCAVGYSNSKSAENSSDAINGTYIGTWQSNGGASGTALLNITVKNDKVSAKFAVLGSPLGYTGDDFVGTVANFGEGIWTVNLQAKNSDMIVNAIFRDGSLYGDYTFEYQPGQVDRGQWVMTMEHR